MTSKKRIFGVLSTIFSMAGTLLLIISYTISTNPTSGELFIIKSSFFSALGSLVISIILSFIGILTGERGFLKFTGILPFLCFPLTKRGGHQVPLHPSLKLYFLPLVR
ncbi:hypothetical protein P4H65_05285 [Paenibacillus chitinolyticus]|uniref:hypothetical protein n=1 Tax=Paenibacillus chitinolyticus TaxID=79263 RepID=UPI002DBDABA9|nr:hypothetical protein [Paenibacillus chitinolyticus]MEC0245205.1 hypothetical protein [Paenibacillus chitinolyticus]